MKERFKVEAPFEPSGDQPEAIEKLCDGINKGFQFQTLLGVTGSGKTFTMAKIIEALNLPTLVISPIRHWQCSFTRSSENSFLIMLWSFS